MSEFNLKSGNTTPFKLMGSSPAKTHEPGHGKKKTKIGQVGDFIAGTSKSGRKVKALFHGGEEGLQKKEEIGDAKRARRERKMSARHANKLAKINKPTRAERKAAKLASSPAKHTKAKAHKHPVRQAIEDIKGSGKVWVGETKPKRGKTDAEKTQKWVEKGQRKSKRWEEKQARKAARKGKKSKGWAVKVGGLTAGGGDLKKYEKMLSKEKLAQHKTQQSKTYKGL